MVLASALGRIHDIQAKRKTVTAFCLTIYNSIVLVSILSNISFHTCIVSTLP
jgi:MFS-type transporter involved in bile tolerance (Atg22 family)